MAAISELSKQDLLSRWNSTKKSLAKVREQGESVARRGFMTLSGLAGGAADGCIRGMWGDPTKDGGAVCMPGTEIEATTVLGTVVSGVAAFGMLGDASDYGTAFAIGMLAPVTSREVETAVRTAMKK